MTISLLRHGRDGHVATAARTGPGDSALSWEENADQRGSLPDQLTANKTNVPPGHEPLMPTFFLSTISACVRYLSSNPLPSLSLMFALLPSHY